MVPQPPARPGATPAYAPPVHLAPGAPQAGHPAGGYPAGGYPGGGYPAPAPDTRPKTLGLAALIVGIVGFVLALVGFVPIPVVSLVAAVIGGLALLVALVLAIVALASKTQGGKGLGIGAIVVSVVGGIVWIFAIIVSILYIGLAAAIVDDSSGTVPSVSVAPVDPGTDTDQGTTTDAGGQAYLDEVKPQILAILQQIEPSITEDALDSVYSDDQLVSIGESLVSVTGDGRDAARKAFISSVSASGGTFTDDTAGQFFDVVVAAADKHLAG